jgi:hypothetical protein
MLCTRRSARSSKQRNTLVAVLRTSPSHFRTVLASVSFVGLVVLVRVQPLLALPDWVIAGRSHSSQTIGQRSSLTRTISIFVAHVA